MIGWEKLTDIAQSQPQAAYIALTKAYKSKFTYFMRTIDGFKDYVSPIDALLREKFLPTIFDLETPLESPLSELVTLSPKFGGLGIPSLQRDSTSQFNASKVITKNHVNSIVEQSSVMKIPAKPIEKIKLDLKQQKAEKNPENDGGS